MQTKSFEARVKAAGPADGLGEGQFEAVVSVFGNEDTYGDVVMPGAFKADLEKWNESGDPIPVIWSHDWADPFSHIGTVVKAEERPEGLWVQAQMLDLDTNPKAAQVYNLMKGRRVKQFSFAYDVLDGAMAKRDGREVYELREMKLHEVGPCLLGVNQETELLAVKAQHLVADAKAGRTLSQKNYNTLRDAYDAIGAVLESATEDPKSSDSPESEKTDEPSQADGTQANDEGREVKSEESASKSAARRAGGVANNRQLSWVGLALTLGEQMAALKSAVDQTMKAAKDEGRELTEDELTDIETKGAEFQALKERAERTEKAAATVASLASAPAHEDIPAPKSDEPILGPVGQRFVKSDAFQAFRKAHPSGTSSGTPIRIEAKGIGSVRDLGVGGRKADLTTSTGQFVSEAREPGYRNGLDVDEPLTFLDLVTAGSTNVAFSEYAQVIAETDNAAVVLEGALKPLSDLTTDTAESKAFTYADGFVVTNQTLADDGALVAFMESRIRQHVRGVIERKLFNGTGTNEPRGIMNTTGTLAQVFDTDAVTTLARALEKVQANNGNSSVQAIVMNPADIWSLRLLREDGATGGYMLGNPLQQGVTPTPFGVPLVPSNKLTAGTALVGRFDSVQYLELEPLNVLAFNQHENFAQLNKTYVRAESRGRQLFYMPREVVVTDIAAA